MEQIVPNVHTTLLIFLKMARLDRYRIQIPLNEKQNRVVSNWKARMTQQSNFIWAEPEITQDSLVIHPADFANLCSFADAGDCSQFEYYFLRKLGEKALKQIQPKRKTEQELVDMVEAALSLPYPTA